jgi:ADP-heptose:LPS heptosyltransferase
MTAHVNSSSLRTVLVTRHDKIGDFVLCLPLVKLIKINNPRIRVGVLVSAVNYDLARSIEFIDFVILYDQDFWATVRDIRLERPDLSISCYIDNRLGALLLASRIPIRIAPATKLAQIFFNRCIAQRRSRVTQHEWQYNLALAHSIFSAESLVFAPPLLHFLGTAGRLPRVIFHPGSGGSSEGNLRPLDYVRLARRVAAVSGFEAVFTFGPSDQRVYDEIRAALDFPAVVINDPMPLIDFCKYISQSMLFVSTSTGPMHLAGAVNTPTLSFFGTSLFASDKRWAPINNPRYQSNFLVGATYEKELVHRIETHMIAYLQACASTEAHQ